MGCRKFVSIYGLPTAIQPRQAAHGRRSITRHLRSNRCISSASPGSVALVERGPQMLLCRRRFQLPGTLGPPTATQRRLHWRSMVTGSPCVAGVSEYPPSMHHRTQLDHPLTNRAVQLSGSVVTGATSCSRTPGSTWKSSAWCVVAGSFTWTGRCPVKPSITSCCTPSPI